ncbi:hypothetical protein FV242_23075 [Methylobacterium sp. WL64]|uniref:hypothetical protein n=1 Tax=Methylobacterium sp. WL64 TaxID=2603894 RepID=UPI0011C924D9|nr:hypothetical protein [Methylobacterium sp. WL64]TXN00176.1 hypothetical protein FV242_23075 [Methylobacterium sp. WL64]
MPITKRQLAAAVLGAAHIAERAAIAAFIHADATEFGVNPFARTSAGAVRHVWSANVFEFRALEVHALGLTCLLRAVSHLATETPLVQEILRSGPHTLHAFHHGDVCGIVGTVLYGRPRVPLPMPDLPRVRPGRRREAATPQLDLFSLSS